MIIDSIPSIYNSLGNSDKCNSINCEDNKCICLDKEECGLIRAMLCDEDKIAIETKDEHISFQNENSVYGTLEFCNEKVFSESWKKFFPFYKNVDTFWEELEKEGQKSGEPFFEWLTLFPCIYYLNSEKSITDRNPMIYLSVYSICDMKLQKIFFCTLICRTIGVRGKTQSDKNKVGREITALLHKLGEVTENENYEKIRRGTCRAIDAYCEVWKTKISASKDALIQKMIEYRKSFEIQNYEKKYDYVNEQERKHICYLGTILKETARILNVPIRISENFLVPDAEQEQHEEYGRIIKILGNVRYDKEKKEAVLLKLYELFEKRDEISTDDVEELEELVKNKVIF